MYPRRSGLRPTVPRIGLHWEAASRAASLRPRSLRLALSSELRAACNWIRLCALVVFAACVREEERGVTRRLSGDTISVAYNSSFFPPVASFERVPLRTSSGAGVEFGDVSTLADAGRRGVYAFDRSTPAFLHFSPAGVLLDTIGRSGTGPGEYSKDIIGSAISSGGEVWLHDAGARRVMAFDSLGRSLAQFYTQSGLFTERSLSFDTNDRLRVRAIVGVTESRPRWPWPIGQLLYSKSGRLIDSILPPRLADEPIGSPGVFGASKVWDMRGDLAVVAINTRYVVHLLSPSARPVRIERDAQAPAVSAQEKAWWQQQEPAEQPMAMPSRKPVIRNVLIGSDSTIWVQLATSPTSAELNRLAEFTRPPEPLAFDVYRMDGTMLGAVRLPVSGRVLSVSRVGLFVQSELPSGDVTVEHFRLRWSASK